MLNPTAHAIVSLCNGRDTLESIVSSLAMRYQTSAEKIEAEVSQLLNRLLAKNLLEPFDGGLK